MVKKIAIALLLSISGLLSAQDTYYVSTTGNNANPGTFAQPWATISYGISQIYAGDTLFIRGGVYYVTSGMGVSRSGTGWNNMINIWCYPDDYEAGNPVVVDAENYIIPSPTNWSVISGSQVQYIHFKGIHVRNFYQRVGPDPPGSYSYPLPQGWGFESCANIIFENCAAYRISGRGWFYYSGAWNEWDGPDSPFASDTTRWINCDAYDLCDSLSLNPGNAADGWKCHGYQGSYFSWYGCRAWNYSDDGIDPSGEAYKILEYTWLMSTDKYDEFGVEGNGFKATAPNSQYFFVEYLTDTNLVKITNSIAAFCEGSGFYNNIHPEGGDQNRARIFNNIIYRSNWGFWDFSPQGPYGNTRLSYYANNLVYDWQDATYGQTGIYNPTVYANATNSWIPSGWPPWEANPAFTITSADFDPTLSPETVFAQMTEDRQSDGKLPILTVFRLADNSDILNAGTYVGMSATPSVGIDWEWMDAMYYGTTEIIEVTSITVSATGDATTIETDGGTLQMIAEIVPDSATYQSVTWSVISGTGTASISSSGLLTALTNGTVTVRATAVDGSGVYGEEVITISNQEDEPAPSGTRFVSVGGKFGKSIRGKFTKR